jgi:hypothetical protein
MNGVHVIEAVEREYVIGQIAFASACAAAALFMLALDVIAGRNRTLQQLKSAMELQLDQQVSVGSTKLGSLDNYVPRRRAPRLDTFGIQIWSRRLLNQVTQGICERSLGPSLVPGFLATMGCSQSTFQAPWLYA